MKPKTYEFETAALEVARDLSRDLTQADRLARLLKQLRRTVPYDAAAVLLCKSGELVPAATVGLPAEVMGRRFVPADHPRLAAILNSERGEVFPADDPRPDPYDGMILDDNAPSSVHSCMGAPLKCGDDTLGVLTVDAAGPDRFSGADVDHFRMFSALAAAALQVGRQLESLMERANLGEQKLSQMVSTEPVQVVGESPAMKRLQQEIAIVAPSDLSVLVTGETGTGKELVVRRLHELSPRRDKPMVHVNCAALPESIAESELFGHVKGAFSGAHQDRLGKFELAEHGTLFLDEIGELPLVLQAKLLRAIQFGEIQRVGSDRAIRVDVRIVAATNRNLEAAVAEGTFREDLYHRVSVYPIRTPALRDRMSDIDALAGFFLEKHRGRLGTLPLRLTEAALEDLRAYAWPGNVRELESVLMRGALRAQTRATHDPWITIDAQDLFISRSSPRTQAQSLAEATREFQRQLVADTIRQCDGNLAQAARVLDMDRSNFHRTVKRLEL
ncbi:MAG: nitric oxide reductase transcriptional regulator NorR [bacterium]